MVEVIVTLSVMGIIAGTVAFTIGPVKSHEISDDPSAYITNARREAIQTGRPVRVAFRADGYTYLVLALPDGRVVADSLFGVNQMTGRRRAQ